MFKSTRIQHLSFLLFILLSIVLIGRKSHVQPPIGKHMWSQSDWYALSLGFLNNGMDFWHPETFHLNNKRVNGELQSITATDCPMHPYAVASLMKLFKTKSAMVFRLYTLLLSLTGLFLFYLAVYKYSGSILWAAVLTSLIRFQPTYAFYMNGFIPTQQAFSLFLFSFYFFTDYLKHKRILPFFLGTLFLTLAALTRIPFSIPVLALLGTFTISTIIQRKLYWKEILILTIPILCVGSYYIYNVQLANTFGSAFLNKPLPATSIAEFLNYFIIGFAYNQRTILPFTSIFIVVVSVFVLIKDVKSNQLKINKGHLLYITIMAFGALLYAVLMVKQLKVHDYYYNDFLFPVIVCLLFLISGYPILASRKKANTIGIFFLIAAFQTGFSYQSFEYANGFKDYPHIHTQWNYENAEAFLSDQNIPEDAIMMVIGAYAPSVPLYNMNRKGFNVLEPRKDKIDEAFEKPFDYLVTQNQYFADVLLECPDWQQRTQFVATNGKISIWLATRP